jgi:hypothetical protein
LQPEYLYTVWAIPPEQQTAGHYHHHHLFSSVWLHSNMGFVSNYLHNQYENLSICLSTRFKVKLYLNRMQYTGDTNYHSVPIHVADVYSNGMIQLHILVVDIGSNQFHSIN